MSKMILFMLVLMILLEFATVAIRSAQIEQTGKILSAMDTMLEKVGEEKRNDG